MNTYDRVREQFGKTAQGYVTSPGHASGADLDTLIALAGDVEGRRVLDVATGGGHTALAFARAGARVTATDLTPEMLVAARNFITSQGMGEVAFQPAAAEQLPFDDGTFDVVSCRIAPHHFADPEAFVREAARVLVPGGLFMLIDNIAPEVPELGGVVNRIERERDPSHVEAYTVRRWVDWLADAGFEVTHLQRFSRDKDYRDWLERAHTPSEVGEALERYVLGLPLEARRYLRVVEEGGKLVSLAHEVALIVAAKPG